MSHDIATLENIVAQLLEEARQQGLSLIHISEPTRRA